MNHIPNPDPLDLVYRCISMVGEGNSLGFAMHYYGINMKMLYADSTAYSELFVGLNTLTAGKKWASRLVQWMSWYESQEYDILG